MNRVLFLASLCVAACSGGGKADVNDDFSAIADEKSDAFSSRMKIVGTLTDPRGEVQFAYSATPLYRAVKLRAQAGDWLKVTVMPWGKVAGGNPADPVTFLLDSRFKVVAKNDDANDQMLDSQIVVQLKKSGTFYVVVRDYNYADVQFDATLAFARPSDNPVADANAWFQFFFLGDDYNELAAPYSVSMSRMPKAARDDANGFFKKDVGGAGGYALPYGDSVMYMLTGSAEEAYDARPYDADGHPIADTAIGGDAGDIFFR